MLNDFIQGYLGIWKSIFKLKEPLSRKRFWLFLGINYLGSIICNFFPIHVVNVFWILFIISSFLSGIKRMNDIKLPWIYLLIPVYNLYLLAKKGGNKQDLKYIPIAKNAHLNLKSFLLAFAFSVITVTTLLVYFSSHGGGGFINIGAFIGVGIGAIVFFVFFFVIVRLVAYYIVANKIYPHIRFQILVPFLVITYICVCIYGLIYFEPFGMNKDYFIVLKQFSKFFIPYTTCYTIIIGKVFSLGHAQDKIIPNKLFRDNLVFVLAVSVLSISTLFMFYTYNKIDQPEIDKKYLSYKSIKETIISEKYKIELLLPENKIGNVSKPYFLKNSSELILSTSWSNVDDDKPIEAETCYKINKDGIIVSEINTGELQSPNIFPIVFDKGYLRDNSSTIVSTWTFDGNRERIKYKDLKKNKNWKIETLSKDSTSIKEVAFFRKSKFHCNNRDIQHDGTKYYNVTKSKDILGFRVDSVYSHTDNIKNCAEEKIAYYECKGMNFSLLCLGERDYYIIKPLKKAK